ncbi:hypothetical protein D3C72_1899130 [compost metagenome]
MPVWGRGAGTVMRVTISSGAMAVLPTPVTKSSTRSSREPDRPYRCTEAPSATSGAIESADGDARQTLPTTVARWRTWIEAKSVTAFARLA